MNVAALASTSHQPGLFDMVASPWLSVRVGGSKPPGSYTAYCPNVNLGGVARPSRHDRPPGVGASPRLTVFAARVAEAEPHERPLAALRGGRLAPDTLRRKGASARRPRAGQPPGEPIVRRRWRTLSAFERSSPVCASVATWFAIASAWVPAIPRSA